MSKERIPPSSWAEPSFTEAQGWWTRMRRPVTFHLQSEVSRGVVRGRFRFDFRTKPERVLLRLRHPDGALPREAEADGKPLALTGEEWVSPPLTTRRLEVRYERRFASCLVGKRIRYLAQQRGTEGRH